MEQTYDLIVVGCGGVGSAAAYHLAKAGHRVLVLEQFTVGHNRGSSHGASRIIRHSYAETDYVSLVPPTFALWQQLEAESGAQLLQITGGVEIAPPDHPELVQRIAALRAENIPIEIREGAAASAALPQFRIPPGWVALQQNGAGILNADRCVRTMADQAVALGAELREGAQVSTVRPDGDGVVVEFVSQAGTETAHAQRAIITAGPWASRFFHQLSLPIPLTVTHQQVAYYAVEDPALYDASRCPVYIFFGEPGFYGFPISERPGQIKVAWELDQAIADPDLPPLPPDSAARDMLSAQIAKYMVGVAAEPSDVVTCRYTVSPDHDFIIDRHPEHAQIVLGSPCSGHGFKFAITSGALLADLATSPAGTYTSPLWRERFSLRRRLEIH